MSRLRAEALGDQLGRAAADVDDDGARLERPDAAQGHRRLLVAGEQPGREAVRPLDLAEERLAVLGVADGARRDGERALGAELLELAAVVGEHVPHARDGDRQEAPARVDALAEPRDARPAHDLLDAAVLDVGDEQPRGVRAEVDRGDARHLRRHEARGRGRTCAFASAAAARSTASCASDVLQVLGRLREPLLVRGERRGALLRRRRSRA